MPLRRSEFTRTLGRPLPRGKPPLLSPAQSRCQRAQQSDEPNQQRVFPKRVGMVRNPTAAACSAVREPSWALVMVSVGNCHWLVVAVATAGRAGRAGCCMQHMNALSLAFMRLWPLGSVRSWLTSILLMLYIFRRVRVQSNCEVCQVRQPLHHAPPSSQPSFHLYALPMRNSQHALARLAPRAVSSVALRT